MPGGGRARCVLYLPGWKVKPDEYATLKSGPELLPAVKAYWKRILAPAMQVEVPEPLLNDVIVVFL